jgi:monofunctional biosynthetic peptidoglycan transglycosylase
MSAGRLLRGGAIGVIGLVVLPYLLTIAYLFLPPVSTPMLWRWLTFQRVERRYVPLARISPALQLAVIVAEDSRYCSHYGIDLKEIRQAIEEADDLGEARGASTITQQTAKNLFLWSGRSLLRKALEFPLALWIDLVLPKPRVLEIYLNVAEWGPHGEFGAEAGARRAFGKSAQRLSAGEAALLAAVLPNPARRNARRLGRGLRRLARIYAARARASRELDDCVRPPRKR